MLKAKGGWEGPGRGRRVALLDAFSTSQTPEGVSCICWGHIFPFPARLIHYGADSRWWNQWSRCESSWKIMSFSLTADSIVWVYLGCYSACIMLYTCKYLHEHRWKYKLYFPKSLHIFVKMQVHFCIIFFLLRKQLELINDLWLLRADADWKTDLDCRQACQTQVPRFSFWNLRRSRPGIILFLDHLRTRKLRDNYARMDLVYFGDKERVVGGDTALESFFIVFYHCSHLSTPILGGDTTFFVALEHLAPPFETQQHKHTL